MTSALASNFALKTAEKKMARKEKNIYLLKFRSRVESGEARERKNVLAGMEDGMSG